MDTFIQEDNLNYIYSTYSHSLHVFQAPPKLHIFVTHYNSFSYLLKCIASIFTQKISIPFDITLVDDCSDLPDHFIQEFDRWKEMEPLRLRIHRNTSRQSKGINLFKCLEMTPCHPEDVICVLDGDDWLSDENSLQKVVTAYQTTGCWVTYGSYKHSDGTPGCCTRPLTPEHYDSEKRGRGFREAPWVFSHLFTSKAFLWSKLSKEILTFKESNAKVTADQLFNIPLAEMAGTKRIYFMSDILVIYNNQNPIADCRVDAVGQEKLDQLNRQREAFPILNERPDHDVSILIPCKGRRELLETTLKVLNEEALKTDKRITITLLEHDTEQNYRDFALEKGIGWIYLPLFESPQHPLGQFNRGLCFDMGFIYGPKAKYYLCHDNDLLVPKNFWSLLQQNIERENFQALQTYSDRFVWQTTKEVSEKIQNDLSWYHESFSVKEQCKENPPGAKGGSILVSHDLYLKAGGHDPQLFWGYSPEDRMFWMKLELLTKIGYGDSPSIPLTHLWHLPAGSQNPLLSMMNSAFYSLNSQEEEIKREYILKKSSQFMKFYSTVLESRQ
jgi:hypothetical protein